MQTTKEIEKELKNIANTNIRVDDSHFYKNKLEIISIYEKYNAISFQDKEFFESYKALLNELNDTDRLLFPTFCKNIGKILLWSLGLTGCVTYARFIALLAYPSLPILVPKVINNPSILFSDDSNEYNFVLFLGMALIAPISLPVTLISHTLGKIFESVAQINKNHNYMLFLKKQLQQFLSADNAALYIVFLLITPADYIRPLLPYFSESKSTLYTLFKSLVEKVESHEDKIMVLDSALDKNSALYEIFNYQRSTYGYYVGKFFQATHTIAQIKNYKEDIETDISLNSAWCLIESKSL